MTIFRAGNATIEMSSDGQNWQPIHGFQANQSWDEPAHPSPLAGVKEGIERSMSITGMAAPSMIPWMQEAVATQARAEEERYREREWARLGWDIGNQIVRDFSVGFTITWFNRGYFDHLCGLHTRHAMRHRKLARYRQKMGNR